MDSLFKFLSEYHACEASTYVPTKASPLSISTAQAWLSFVLCAESPWTWSYLDNIQLYSASYWKLSCCSSWNSGLKWHHCLSLSDYMPSIIDRILPSCLSFSSWGLRLGRLLLPFRLKLSYACLINSFRKVVDTMAGRQREQVFPY